ncbi:MAG: methyltransferase [Candidatus Woesearchaeota archaeon]
MYKNELNFGYDAWYQEDLRHIQRHVILNLLNQYNFDIIFDIGCGKGLLTHLLKKKNNTVIGIDISKTAIKQAKTRYPDIKWLNIDVSDKNKLIKVYKKYKNNKIKKWKVLTLYIDILSYLKNWKELIEISSNFSGYILVSLYIPKDPIGFVKNFEELESVILNFYSLEEIICFKNLETIIYFGKKK